MMQLILCIALGLSGCAAPIVRCDTHLVPINAPNAKPAAPAATVQEVP